MKKVFAGALATVAVAAAGTSLVAHSGVVDVAADVPHDATLVSLVTWVREQSIARRSADIAIPGDLADGERIRRGAGNYAAMCAGCHLAPGVADSELTKGLNPPPPNLSLATAAPADGERLPARQFRIVKHGVAATGMPAWGKVGMSDAEVWDLVAFLQALPTLDAAGYRQRVAASDGHSHADAGQHAAHVDQAAKKAGREAHDHAGHAH
ncbi:MAG: cytochrome c [Rhodocyclales bacterium]|nr:cytochrome c [Rhodocyclales bacterium]